MLIELIGQEPEYLQPGTYVSSAGHAWTLKGGLFGAPASQIETKINGVKIEYEYGVRPSVTIDGMRLDLKTSRTYRLDTDDIADPRVADIVIEANEIVTQAIEAWSEQSSARYDKERAKHEAQQQRDSDRLNNALDRL